MDSPVVHTDQFGLAVDTVRQIAAEHNATQAQLALA
jgi:hypothetical protein